LSGEDLATEGEHLVLTGLEEVKLESGPGLSGIEMPLFIRFHHVPGALLAFGQ
jgi:hypothetical protein